MTKDQLRSYRDIVKDIADMEEELMLIDSQFSKLTCRWSDMPKGVNKEQRDIKMAELLDTKIQLQEDINDLILIQVRQRKNILQAVRDLPVKHRRIIHARYIFGLGWVDVCTRCHYEWSQTHLIHGEALKLLEKGSD
jgi:septation ring formation regulator EzrA